MRYCSTRGGDAGVTFSDALARGYAADGGLYVPEELPKISPETLSVWSKLDFPSLALELLKLFVGDELSEDVLSLLVRGSYDHFTHRDIVPLISFRKTEMTETGSESPVFIAELFHGPTFCFKDLGQQLLVRLLAHFAERDGKKRTFLVSTTGDTGPAAMRAVADAASSCLRIVVFYPEGQISELQRRQMTTISGRQATVVTFEGGGDDMDLPLKRLAADSDFAQKHGLCGINSYNLGRPLAQLPHFFWSYFRAVDHLAQLGSEVDFVIPAGALGNTASAFMARQMGLPIRCLIAGVNQNDITYRTISTGCFHRSDCMFKTLSDAINIQVPYNMERIFYYLTGEDSSLIKTWMLEMENTGRLTLSEDWRKRMQNIFDSARIDDDAMCEALRTSVDEYGYLPCPHSAVALGAHFATTGRTSESTVPARVIFATASPCKFEASVTTAIGHEEWKKYEESPAFPETARALLRKEERKPFVWRAKDTLSESQSSWEKNGRAIMGGFGNSGGLYHNSSGAMPETLGNTQITIKVLGTAVMGSVSAMVNRRATPARLMTLDEAHTEMGQPEAPSTTQEDLRQQILGDVLAANPILQRLNLPGATPAPAPTAPPQQAISMGLRI
ncbi:unnamed protein product [Durusdinium trenchii]|uniref:Threonine synthase n=1 Tax=Durusdinium trenchii TaxID=1381693 RepID=A0ABP0PK61_9DINO